MFKNGKAVIRTHGSKQNNFQHINGSVLSVINSIDFRPVTQQKLCGKCKTDDLRFSVWILDFWLCIRCQQRAEHYFRHSQAKRDFCSFCQGEMIDDSIRFKGISACSKCLRIFVKFDEDLRNYMVQRKVKYEGG